MEDHRFWKVGRMLVLTACCLLAVLPQTAFGRDAAAVLQKKANRITNAQREAAAARAAATATTTTTRMSAMAVPTVTALAMPAMNPGGTPDYFNVANWAYTPIIPKFVDSLPGLGVANKNNLGQYIPVAIPDITTYPGSDYYEISLVEYSEKMHTNLPATKLRGYVQTNTTDANVSKPHYLGPLIIAQRNRPVRVKFTNNLPTGVGGNLFIPVDTTVMGAGMGPLDMNVPAGYPMNYSQNRGTLHLHGGLTPWISDGTPHQWVTPANELTPYPKGVSVQNVPDMNDPGPGSMTFYYTNQQSARLMFYHDHSYGITRLNVYAGEAAGYLVQDPNEQALVVSGVVPSTQVPLVIQDKTFVDANTIAATDPTWNWGSMPGMPMSGDLWFPHVYMPNQNPADANGVNQFGRWDYGPWFWPPVTAASGLVNGPITLANGTQIPGVPNTSMVMEAFMDTPVINGTAYPYLSVQQKAYRFRILNACNDRFLNLQIYYATPISFAVTNGGSGYSSTPTITLSAPASGVQATATATVSNGVITNIWLTNPGSGYVTAPTVTITDTTGTGATAVAGIGLNDVKMVPAYIGNWPAGWPTPDARDGGLPDPATRGPAMIQIGTEGGILPLPALITNIPVGYDRDPRSITVGNVKEHGLLLGPAERADVIIDFNQVPAGATLILYNDAPAPVPGIDKRLDYYTGDPCQTTTGGTKTTLPGFGPNTRTLMQIRVAGTAAVPFVQGPVDSYNTTTMTALNTALPAAFKASQDPIIAPQAAYNSVYGGTFTDTKSKIADTALTFTPIGSVTPLTIQMLPKAIQELFELDYGRMNSTLGVELPLTNFNTQTTIPFGYIDPATEIMTDSITAMSPVAGDGTQIWKLTHNGVDTHAIHFHLFNVQVINRVDWAGVIKMPDRNELGWKDTVRMNPLEDCIVAMRPIAPKQPFGIPDSNRPLDPTMPIGSAVGFSGVDQNNQPVNTTNQYFNFGWEYVWHCHLLGHEEMDMMRPMVFNVARVLPTAPVLSANVVANAAVLTWTDATPVVNPASPANLGNPANEIGFRIERAIVNGGLPGAYAIIGSALANATTYTDSTAGAGSYSYRVVAYNAAGESPSNSAAVTAGGAVPVAPTNLVATRQTGPQVSLTWTDNASNETGFVIERSANGGTFTQIAAPGASAGTGAAVSYTDTTVIAGNNYTYRVKAMNAGVSSSYAVSANVVISLPVAPTNIRATLGANLRVTVTWTDNDTFETGFVLERSVNTGTFAQIAVIGPSTGSGLTVTYTDTTVTSNTYAYRVKTMSGTVSSAYATSANLVVPPPTAPTNLVATLQAGPQISLTWTDNATTETGFVLERSVNGGAFARITAPGPRNNTGSVSYVDAAVSIGSSYRYQVKAVSGAVSSTYAVSATVTVPPIPNAPTLTSLTAIRGNGNNDTVTARWADVANETSYTVQRATNAAFTSGVTTTTGIAANSTSLQQTIKRGTTVWYRVQAVNFSGASAWSNVRSITAP